MNKLTSTDSYKWGIFAPSILLLLAAGIYSVYWFVAAADIDDEVAAWVQRQEQQGYQISYSAIDVGGFPYRFEALLTDFAIAAPDHPYQWIWTTDELNIISLAYRFDQFIFEAYGEQNLVYEISPSSEQFIVDARADALRGSATLIDGIVGNVAIDIVGLDADRHGAGLALQQLTAERLQLHLRPSESVPEQESDFGTDLFVRGSQIGLTGHSPSFPVVETVKVLQGKFTLGAIDSVTLLEGDKIESWLRAGGTIRMSDLALTWEGYGILGKGKLGLDGYARPMGEVELEIFGHRQIVELLVKNGAIDRQTGQIADASLNLLALANPSENGSIRAPLQLRNGAIFLGPARLGATTPIEFD